MKHLFVIVGLPKVGKSTLLKEFCNNKYRIEYFTNDTICRLVMDLCKVYPYFSIADSASWEVLNKFINIKQAKYWFYVMALLNIHGRIALSDGYLYLYKAERDILESALKKLSEDCQVHYLHLLPSLEIINIYRNKRNTPPLKNINYRICCPNLTYHFAIKLLQMKMIY